MFLMSVSSEGEKLQMFQDWKDKFGDTEADKWVKWTRNRGTKK